MPNLDPQETLFLQFIKGFTVEDIRTAITGDVDLAELVKEEYDDDVLTELRHYARLYDVTHPGKRAELGDLDKSAKNVLEWLKANGREDLSGEIASYEFYATAGTMGLSAVTSTGQQAVPYVSAREHVGTAWLKSNIRSMAELLLS